MIFLFWGVKFLRYRCIFFFSKYRFLYFFKIWSVFCSFIDDFFGFCKVFQVPFWKFEFFFPYLWVSVWSSSSIIFFYYFLFFYFFMFGNFRFQKCVFRGKLWRTFSIENIVLSFNYGRFVSLEQAFNFVIPIESLLYILNNFHQNVSAKNFVYWYIWNNEVKFLYTILFSRLFLMFCEDPYRWDSDGNIIISDVLSSYVDKSFLDVDLGKQDLYSKGLNGYLLLIALHKSGLDWFMSQVFDLDFTEFWYEDSLNKGYLNKLSKRYSDSDFTEFLFRARLFVDWRNFLLDLWFNNLFFFSNLAFLKVDLFRSLVFFFNKSKFYEIFDLSLIKFDFNDAFVFKFCLNPYLEFSKCLNLFLETKFISIYKLKRRV